MVGEKVIDYEVVSQSYLDLTGSTVELYVSSAQAKTGKAWTVAKLKDERTKIWKC